MKTHEVNFDGIVGPNHNYAGLAAGNLASQIHSRQISRPKEAALQGLKKMKLLRDLGIKQAVLPPHARPNLHILRQLGFYGTNAEIINKAATETPQLLAAVYSSSSMWAANCATISPSRNCDDHKLHLTPANLTSNFHRSQESHTSRQILQKIFNNSELFEVHKALPSCEELSDEGAANHLSLRPNCSSRSIEIFVYGKNSAATKMGRFHPRQSLAACQSIARLHRLKSQNTLFIKQSQMAIDTGVFHNDVISTSNDNFFLVHDSAFENQNKAIASIKQSYSRLHPDKALFIHSVSDKQLSLADAVKSYLFNTQIVTLPDNSMCIIAPEECRENNNAQAVIDELIASESPICKVHFLDLRQSMSNGGGPACLRLRVPLNDKELAAIHPQILLTDKLYQQLHQWIEKHYRDELAPEDLADPQLICEIQTALDELTQILNFGSFYDFQK